MLDWKLVRNKFSNGKVTNGKNIFLRNKLISREVEQRNAEIISKEQCLTLHTLDMGAKF